MRLFKSKLCQVSGSIHTQCDYHTYLCSFLHWKSRSKSKSFYLRILRKDKKKYAFVLENYLQIIYLSISCMMVRNIGQNNEDLMNISLKIFSAHFSKNCCPNLRQPYWYSFPSENSHNQPMNFFSVKINGVGMNWIESSNFFLKNSKFLWKIHQKIRKNPETHR